MDDVIVIGCVCLIGFICMAWTVVCEDDFGAARHGWRPTDVVWRGWPWPTQGGGGIDHPNEVQQKRVQTEI